MKTGLEIQLTDEGAVVEDSTRDRVHFLNPTAALVLSLCDGSLHPEAIVQRVQEVYSLDQPPRDEVNELLRQFIAEGLLSSGNG
jgi:hypothetical protein